MGGSTLPRLYRLGLKTGFIRNRMEIQHGALFSLDRSWFGYGKVVGVPGGGINLENERAQLAVLKNPQMKPSSKGIILQGVVDGKIKFEHAPEAEVRGAIEPLKADSKLGKLAESALKKLYPERVTSPAPVSVVIPTLAELQQNPEVALKRIIAGPKGGREVGWEVKEALPLIPEVAKMIGEPKQPIAVRLLAIASLFNLLDSMEKIPSQVTHALRECLKDEKLRGAAIEAIRDCAILEFKDDLIKLAKEYDLNAILALKNWHEKKLPGFSLEGGLLHLHKSHLDLISDAHIAQARKMQEEAAKTRHTPPPPLPAEEIEEAKALPSLDSLHEKGCPLEILLRVRYTGKADETELGKGAIKGRVIGIIRDRIQKGTLSARAIFDFSNDKDPAIAGGAAKIIADLKLERPEVKAKAEEKPTTEVEIKPTEIELAHFRDRFGFTSAEKLKEVKDTTLTKLHELNIQIAELQASRGKIGSVKKAGEEMIGQRLARIVEIEQRRKELRFDVERKYLADKKKIRAEADREIERSKQAYPDIEGNEELNANQAGLRQRLIRAAEETRQAKIQAIDNKIEQELAGNEEAASLQAEQKIIQEDLNGTSLYDANIPGLQKRVKSLGQTLNQINVGLKALRGQRGKLYKELKKIRGAALEEKTRVIAALTEDVIAQLETIWSEADAALRNNPKK